MVLHSHAYELSLYAIPTAATTLLMFMFGLRVLVGRVSRVSAAFFALTFVSSIWLAAYTLMYMATEHDVALRWAKAGYLGVPFIAPAVYQFTVEMLRIAGRRRFAISLAWALALVFSALAATTQLLIAGVDHYWWGYYPRYALAGSIPFLVFMVGYLAGSLGEFIRAHAKSRGVERIRVRLLIISFAVSYVALVDLLPNFGVPIYPFGYVPLIACAFIIAHVVRRYDLVPITPSLAANEIINTISDVLFVCDRDGRIQFANYAAERLLGYESHELTGSLIEELIPGEGLNASLQRRSLRSTEYTFLTRSRESVVLALSISPVMHAGDAAGAIIIGRDMRENKRAEQEVRRAVTLLQSTFDSTADAILVTSGDGQILTYNKRYLDMWGMPKEMVEWGDHRAILRVLGDQLVDSSGYLDTIERIYLQPEAESFDLLEFKDGRRFERYSTGRKVEGVAVVRVWSFRDITARHNAEMALRESESRYRLLFEQNAAGVCVTKQDGEIIDCNSTFSLMLGYRRVELLGRNIAEIYERPAEREELIALLKDSAILNGIEMELRREDGRKVWVLQNLSMIGHGTTADVHATVVDISDRKRAEEQIEFHAYHDVLTHLPNRRLFTDRLSQSLPRAKRSGKPVAVFFIDLDHFKKVNDTLGHTAGDELLLEMSHRLRACVREVDTVARLGGDEFTMVLSDLRHPEDAVQVAEKVLAAVKQPMSIAGMPVELSASIGIAIYPTDGQDVETLLKSADSAMYRAKASGRNNYQLCTADMKSRALDRSTMETRLRRALPGNELMLLYQPQINLVTGRTVGVEALVRWNDPERGVIEPVQFIPVAEESRLIVPLGEWVLRAACTQAREWQEQGLGFLRVGVNLSARQFQQHDLADMIRRILVETKADPAALELEITETTAMQTPDLSIEILDELTEIGVSISIDDFGTGYSSLAYLKRFPIKAVKIDREFTAGVSDDEGAAAIVNAVIAIARSMRLRVVAEGVETREQFAFLQRHQCDEAQGYYFSRPVAAGAITASLVGSGKRDLHESRLIV